MNKVGLVSLSVLTVLDVVWAVSLGTPNHSHLNDSESLLVITPILAITLGLIVGSSIKGPIGSILNINRIIAWFFAFGFLWIHYAYSMHHGDSSGLKALDLVPRVFFIVAFSWIAFHAGVAQKTYGWPWKRRPKNMHDWYVLLSWGVLLITIPVFSIPVLGASQILMAIAWILFGPHLLFNVYQLGKRSSIAFLSKGFGLWLLVMTYAVLEIFAAVRSFPGL